VRTVPPNSSSPSGARACAAKIRGEDRAACAAPDHEVASDRLALHAQPAGARPSGGEDDLLGGGALHLAQIACDAATDVPERAVGAIEALDVDIDGEAAGAAADAGAGHQNTGDRT
jgi:hypothetical protein